MTRLRWEGIPEQYWPDTEKPWRVTWGLGAFSDHATREQADAEAERVRKQRPDDQVHVFDATELRDA